MTGWENDWMGDDWMAFNLKVHQKLGALETTTRVTRIHATDGGRHRQAEPRARRVPLRSRTAGARGKESTTSCKAASRLWSGESAIEMGPGSKRWRSFGRRGVLARRLGRWPASWRGSPKDPNDHSVDSPSRRRLPPNPGAQLDSVCRGHLPSQGYLVTRGNPAMTGLRLDRAGRSGHPFQAIFPDPAPGLPLWTGTGRGPLPATEATWQTLQEDSAITGTTT
jgi:hypothetical protein